MLKLTCSVCGADFYRQPSNFKQSAGRYCSRECMRIGRTTAPADRFWSKVKKTETCWLWQRGLVNGYGQFMLTTGQYVSAHRYAYAERYGPIPDGMDVCHKCDMPACVNPVHLFLGTHTDNMHDMISKGRSITIRGDRNGSSKLAAAAIPAIRKAFARGETQTNIGRRYGVSRTAIRNIVTRKTWAHIP